MTTLTKILVVLTFITLIIHLVLKDIGMAEQISSLTFGIVFASMLGLITLKNFRTNRSEGFSSAIISVLSLAVWVAYHCYYFIF